MQHLLFIYKMYQYFFHEQDVPIQIPWNAHRDCIHMQYTLVLFHVQCASILIHMQYTLILYSWEICTTCILGNKPQHSWVIHIIFTFWFYTQSLVNPQRKYIFFETLKGNRLIPPLLSTDTCPSSRFSFFFFPKRNKLSYFSFCDIEFWV